MSEKAVRSYVALIQFPEKQPIWFGTTVIRREAPQHEVEEALRSHIARHLPDGWVIRNIVAGAIFFVPEEA